MNVIVTPAFRSRQEWTLSDRLGRKLGQITQFSESQFLVSAQDTSVSGPLAQMDAAYTSLTAALNAIALHMRGACRFVKAEDE